MKRTALCTVNPGGIVMPEPFLRTLRTRPDSSPAFPTAGLRTGSIPVIMSRLSRGRQEDSMSVFQHIAAAAPWLSPTESAALTRFADQVRARYRDRVKRTVLFGSRARGEGHEESDLDVAVILTGADQPDRRALIDLSTDIFLETDIRISPVVLSQDEFDTLLRLRRGVALAIRDEGIEW